MQLTKHHGLGNDFLILLDEHQSAGPVDPARLAELAVRWCDRRRGIGADGLILGARPTAGGDLDVVMHLRNADGSIAELSGNGIRCLAQALSMARGGVERVLVGTDAGARQLVLEPGRAVHEVQVSVEMGCAAAGPVPPAGALDVLGGRRHVTVDVGNPHLVVLVDDAAALGELDVAGEGAAIEASFDAGINVEYVAVNDRDRVALRVWERGAGLTEACGTGATAAVEALVGWGLVDSSVSVAMPGGDVVVSRDEQGRLTLRGPSVYVATLEVPDD